MKCDLCDNPATIHEVTIRDGQRVEKHLCESCAASVGLGIPGAVPVAELISKYVLEQTTTKAEQRTREGATCSSCGTTFAEFRRTGLLGCAECYRMFEAKLSPLLERAHEGASHHVGKVPRRGVAQQGHEDLTEERARRVAALRRQLDESVKAEQYERAARLRDELRRLGTSEQPDQPHSP